MTPFKNEDIVYKDENNFKYWLFSAILIGIAKRDSINFKLFIFLVFLLFHAFLESKALLFGEAFLINF
jgi:hypothetical protein